MSRIIIFVDPFQSPTYRFVEDFLQAMQAQHPNININFLTTAATMLAGQPQSGIGSDDPLLQQTPYSILSKFFQEKKEVQVLLREEDSNSPKGTFTLREQHCVVANKLVQIASAQSETCYVLFISPDKLELLSFLMTHQRWPELRQHFKFFCSNPSSWPEDDVSISQAFPRGCIEALIKIERPEAASEALQKPTPLIELSAEELAELFASQETLNVVSAAEDADDADDADDAADAAADAAAADAAIITELSEMLPPEEELLAMAAMFRAEAARQEAEAARQEAEAARQEAEAARQKAEAATSQEAEAARQEAEAASQRAEAARQRAEAASQRAEAARQRAEAASQRAEAARQGAGAARQGAGVLSIFSPLIARASGAAATAAGVAATAANFIKNSFGECS